MCLAGAVFIIVSSLEAGLWRGGVVFVILSTTSGVGGRLLISSSLGKSHNYITQIIASIPLPYLDSKCPGVATFAPSAPGLGGPGCSVWLDCAPMAGNYTGNPDMVAKAERGCSVQPDIGDALLQIWSLLAATMAWWLWSSFTVHWWAWNYVINTIQPFHIWSFSVAKSSFLIFRRNRTLKSAFKKILHCCVSFSLLIWSLFSIHTVLIF
jgi:hypothetical protein